MKKLAIILSLIISISSLAQDTLNFKMVDATTYQSYVDKDWNKVIEVGNKALKQDIDYYFLRMRLGIAYYEKTNYRKSIIHFEKAMDMNNEEVVATEYLYYAYKNIGNDIQAMKTLDRSNTKYANKLLDEQKLFQNIYMFFSTRIYDADKLKDASLPAYQKEISEQKGFNPIYTEQFIPGSYYNFQLGGTMRFSPTWRVDLSYQNFQVKKEQHILDPFQETLQEAKVSQTQWNINNTFRISNKMTASLFFTYLSNKIDYIDIKTERIPIQYVEVEQEKIRNVLLGIGLSRQQTYFDINWSASFLTTMAEPAIQTDFGVKIYPFGNRKLISESKVSFLKADSTGMHPVFSQSLSYSPIERLNFSLVGNWGEMESWSNSNGYNVYNGIYGISSLYQANVSVRLVKQLYLKLQYEYMDNSSKIWSKSLIPEDSKDDVKVIEQNNFNTHSIIGGLIWEL